MLGKDNNKVFAYKFEHGETLKDKEIIALFEYDTKIFKKTGKHVVINYDDLEKRFGEITMNDEKKEEMKDINDIEDLKEEVTKKIKKGKVKIILCLVLLIAIIGILVVNAIQTNKLKDEIEYWKNKDPEVIPVVDTDETKIDEVQLLRAIAPIAEIGTYEYDYANFDVSTNTKDLWFIKDVFVDETVFAYSGKITIGIKNAEEIKVAVDEITKTIQVNLPQLSILHNEIVRFESYNIKDSTFVEVNMSEHHDTEESLKTKQEEFLLEDEETWEKIKKRTENVVGSLIQADQTTEGYTIEYSWAE